MKTSQPLLLIGGGADAVAVRYSTGFTAPDPFLCLLTRKAPLLVVSILEIGRARALAPVVDSITIDELRGGKGRVSLAEQAVALCRLKKFKRVTVSMHCPAIILRELERAGIDVRVKKENPFPEREKKSPEELNHLEAAQRATAAGMRAARNCLKESTAQKNGRLLWQGKPLTAERLRGVVDHRLLDFDCVAERSIVACGDQAVDPHETGHGPLYAHQPIVVDIFPCSRTTGYWGDMTRTFIKGAPSREQKSLYQSVLRAQKKALAMVAPGVTGDAIHAAVQKQFDLDGYETEIIAGIPQGFIHGTGHGVGLEIHEQPRVSPGAPALCEGQVITIEPGLYYPGLGGVRIEDTVVVTKEGCRILATFPKAFSV